MPAEPSTKATRRSLRIGPYSVEAPLTLGSLGSAYRATDSSAGRTVALKLLPPELAGSIAARDRFQREAKKAAKVRSPHLANVLDFGDASGTWYLALELAEGPTLAEHVGRHGSLEGEVVRDLLTQVGRVLAVLHREGLVPRDLSADNLRVTQGPDARGRITVKLLDIGLLRPANDDSPADVRTALGGLGTTAWFAATGRTGGKPDLGSLGGDVSDELRGVLRRLLAQRPEERYPTPAALLEALGAEETGGTDEPEPMDESPARQAEPTGAADPGEPLADLAAGIEEDEPPAKQPAAMKKTPRRRDDPPEESEESPMRRDREEEEEKGSYRPAGPGFRPPRGGNRKALIWGGAAFGAVLLLGVVILVVMLLMDNSPKSIVSTGRGPLVVGPDSSTAPADTGKKEGDPKKNPGGEKPPEQPAAGPTVPWLYTAKEPFDGAKLAQEYKGPWSAPLEAPADAVVLRVARIAPTGGKPGTTFDSIAAACAAIPEGKWGIIDIQDNGPLFEGPITVNGRNVRIQGARGFAPLIVWDVSPGHAELKPGKPSEAPSRDEGPAWLTVEKGTLLLNNVHLAVVWPEKAAGTGSLVRVKGGDFGAWETTFSQGGKPHGPLAGVRFEGGAGKRCLLKQCFARGARLTALDVATPGSDVMIETSLLVAAEAPVLSAAGGKSGDASTLRVISSTLVGHQSLLRVRPSPDAATEPALNWMGWDTLLWRSGNGGGGTLVELPKDATAKAMTWRSLNCLYAGWETLLSGHDPVAGANGDGWLALWNRTEGDVSHPHTWVTGLPSDPAETLPWLYRTDPPPGATVPSPVHFRATLGSGVLGCDLFLMPWVRARWLDLTAERTRAVDLEVLDPSKPSGVPEANDLLYHGERLDLEKVPDLGAHLRDVQKRQKLAPMVVMHLHGSGKHKMLPIRLDSVSLYLYVEPPAEGEEPLILEPDLSVAPDGNAVIDITRGNLWIVGADIRCPDFKTALMPSYLVMVRDGNLWVSGTRLQGPVAHPPNSFWGLIRVEGTGNGVRGVMRSASINQCVLLSGKPVLHLACAGQRVDVRDSLIVSTDRAVAIQPATAQKEVPGFPTAPNSPASRQFLMGEAHLNLEFTAEHSTFAAKEAVFFLEDVPVKVDAPPYLWPVIAEPILVQTRDCVFLNPFVEKTEKESKATQAVLLSYSGLAPQRGLLCWQGEGNVYDKRFYAFATSVGKDGKPVRPEKAQAFTAWERLWGSADARPITDATSKGTLDPEKLQLDQLALAAQPPLKEKPGADITKLLGPRKAK
jgi:serine/threonine protein kinase